MKEKSNKKNIETEAYFREIKKLVNEWVDSSKKVLIEMDKLNMNIRKFMAFLAKSERRNKARKE